MGRPPCSLDLSYGISLYIPVPIILAVSQSWPGLISKLSVQQFLGCCEINSIKWSVAVKLSGRLESLSLIQLFYGGHTFVSSKSCVFPLISLKKYTACLIINISGPVVEMFLNHGGIKNNNYFSVSLDLETFSQI